MQGQPRSPPSVTDADSSLDLTKPTPKKRKAPATKKTANKKAAQSADSTYEDPDTDMSPPPRAGSQDGSTSAGGIHHLAAVATHLSSTSKPAPSTSASLRKPPSVAPAVITTPLDTNKDVNSLSLRELVDFRDGLKEDFERVRSDMARMERLLSRGTDHLKVLDDRIQVVQQKEKAPVVWEITSTQAAMSSGEGSGSEKASLETSVMEKDFIEYWGGKKPEEAIKLSERPVVAVPIVEARPAAVVAVAGGEKA